MKTILNCLIISAGVFYLSSCMPVGRITSSRTSTESFIKNLVEKHNEGEYSTIRTCLIFSGPAIGGGSLELTGYKYRGEKNLVIAASQSFSQSSTSAPAKGQAAQTQVTSDTETDFIQLTYNQAKQITENYRILEEKIKNEQPVAGETVYHDFTASNNLFISYGRSFRTSANQSTTFIDFWIKGKKFTVNSSQIIKQLNDFLSY